jgi:hypothetical protein
MEVQKMEKLTTVITGGNEKELLPTVRELGIGVVTYGMIVPERTGKA